MAVAGPQRLHRLHIKVSGACSGRRPLSDLTFVRARSLECQTGFIFILRKCLEAARYSCRSSCLEHILDLLGNCSRSASCSCMHTAFVVEGISISRLHSMPDSTMLQISLRALDVYSARADVIADCRAGAVYLCLCIVTNFAQRSSVSQRGLTFAQYRLAGAVASTPSALFQHDSLYASQCLVARRCAAPCPRQPRQRRIWCCAWRCCRLLEVSLHCSISVRTPVNTLLWRIDTSSSVKFCFG